jgi:hypothetical protein
LVGLAALGALGALAAGFAAGAAFFEVVAFWVRLTSLAALKEETKYVGYILRQNLNFRDRVPFTRNGELTTSNTQNKK